MYTAFRLASAVSHSGLHASEGLKDIFTDDFLQKFNNDEDSIEATIGDGFRNLRV